MFVFNIMCKLFFAIGLGYYLNKKGILTEDVNQHLSSFIIKIATPCLIISSVTSVSSIDQSFVIQLVIIGVAIYCMLPVVAYLLTIVFPWKQGSLVFKARNILMPVCLCSPTVALWHCLSCSPSLEMMPSSITQFCICHTTYYSLRLAVIYYQKTEKQHSHSNRNSSYLLVLFHPWLRFFYSLHIYSFQNASAVLFPLLEVL